MREKDTAKWKKIVVNKRSLMDKPQLCAQNVFPTQPEMPRVFETRMRHAGGNVNRHFVFRFVKSFFLFFFYGG